VYLFQIVVKKGEGSVLGGARLLGKILQFLHGGYDEVVAFAADLFCDLSVCSAETWFLASSLPIFLNSAMSQLMKSRVSPPLSWGSGVEFSLQSESSVSVPSKGGGGGCLGCHRQGWASPAGGLGRRSGEGSRKCVGRDRGCRVPRWWGMREGRRYSLCRF